MSLNIPKKMGHIWIGPYLPPKDLMDSWIEKHSDWEYTLYDNNFLNTFNFRTRPQIDEYLKRGKYDGVADLMRYEILYEYGGFLPAADSICLQNTNELFTTKCAYTVYENEFIRGKLVSPILASEPKNNFLKLLIDELCNINPKDLNDPWISTGNLFVAKMIEKYKPDVIIFPSYFFIPEHHFGISYSGDGKIYSKQFFGSTRKYYKMPKMNIFLKVKFLICESIKQRYHRKAKRKQKIK